MDGATIVSSMLSGVFVDVTIAPDFMSSSLVAERSVVIVTVFPSEVQKISPCKSVLNISTSASRNRLKVSSVGCP